MRQTDLSLNDRQEQNTQDESLMNLLSEMGPLKVEVNKRNNSSKNLELEDAPLE